MSAALVTGSAKRLGAAIVKHLASQGCDVAIHYFSSADAAEDLAETVRAEFGVKAVTVQGDLRDRAQMRQMIPQARDLLGQSLNILVNNASAFAFDRVDDEPCDDFSKWDENFRTNLEAPYFLTQDFAAQCEGEGVVINMIDQRVLRPTPNYGSYSLAKSALHTFTKTAAQALAPQIRVNGIGPGTTLQGAHQSEDNFDYHRRISILERGADVEDILRALDYLVNAKAVTGQMIAVDGGQHLIWQLPDK